MTASEVVIAEALAQVELGFEVFALGRNVKTPVTEHGWKNATGDPTWVRTQLEQKPAGNYGMVWPVDSLPLVIAFDLDDGKEGPGDGPDWTQRMAVLQKRLGKLSMTKQTATPSGGRHMFFYWPADIPLPPGDEALGWTMRYPGRHYVVGPGSTVNGATYESNGLPIATLPKVWVDAIVAEHAPKKALIVVHGDGYDLPESIGPGHRYSTVRDYSASKWAQGLKLEEIWTLVKTEVAPRFTQPKPELELRGDFERSMKKIEDRFGPQPRKGMKPEDAVKALQTINAIRASDVKVEAIEWLWFRHLPIGSVTLFDGNPGEGKSTVVADIVARMTTSGTWPDGSPVERSGPVVYVTKEDDLSRQVKPRIEAAGGRCDDLWFVGDDLLFPRDWGRFHDLIESTRPMLVILDPLMSYLEGRVSTISDNEIRSAVMTPLGELARQYGFAALVVRHFNKGSGQSALYRGAGSLGFAGAARCVIQMMKHPSDEDVRVFGVTKTNFEARPKDMRLVIEAAPVEGFQMTVSKASWQGWSDVSIIDAIERDSEAHERIARAKEDLREILDPMEAISGLDSKTVMNKMTARGHKNKDVHKAATELRVIHNRLPKVPGKGESATVWMLPTPLVSSGMSTHSTRVEVE